MARCRCIAELHQLILMLMLRLADVRLGEPEAEPDGPRKSDFLYRAFARSMPAREKPERPARDPANGSCGRRQWEALVELAQSSPIFRAPAIQLTSDRKKPRPHGRPLASISRTEFIASAGARPPLEALASNTKRAFAIAEHGRARTESGSWGCTSVVSAFRLQRRGAGDLASTRAKQQRCLDVQRCRGGHRSLIAWLASAGAEIGFFLRVGVRGSRDQRGHQNRRGDAGIGNLKFRVGQQACHVETPPTE